MRKFFLAVFILFISCENENLHSLINDVDEKKLSVGNPIYINTIDEFFQYFQGNIQSGDYVILNNNLSVNITQQMTFNIPSNVTIFSYRKQTGLGAEIKFNPSVDVPNNSLFNVFGENVKFIGLRIKGPLYLVDTLQDVNSALYIGIEAKYAHNLQVDGCELSGWKEAAVSLFKTKNVNITSNKIHRNRALNYGYGVVVNNGSFAYIKYNYFHKNRHHIAGSGKSDDFGNYDGYEVSFNTFNMENAFSTGIDMHAGGANDSGPYAGGNILINNNTFLGNDWMPAILIRGIPKNKAIINNNSFDDYTNEEDPIRQRVNFGNFASYNNSFKENNLGIFVSWAGKSDWYRIGTLESNQYTIKEYGFGNFNNDNDNGGLPKGGGIINFLDVNGWKRKDFHLWHGRFLWDWEKGLNNTSLTRQDVLLGDFNGDGLTDVFYANGSTWRVSFSGTENWQILNISNFATNNLRVGDFNGDGIADVFRVDGQNWYVSYSGTSAWQLLNSSALTINQLAFGDFNGDGKTDVFKADGQNWYVSYSGTSAWQLLNSSALTINQLAFGDFNGDGKTDVLKADGQNWYVSYSGTGSWIKINTSSQTLNELEFWDINEDGKTDIISLMHSF